MIHRKSPDHEYLAMARSRVRVIFLCILIGYLLIIGRLFELGIEAQSIHHNAQTKPVAPPSFQVSRADIQDRNGVILATTLMVPSLYANDKQITNIDEAVNGIMHVLPDQNPDALREKLASGKEFVWLARHLTPDQEYALNALGIPGLYFQREEKRIYPLGRSAPHVLGFTNVDGNGIAGIEKTFDERLKKDSTPLTLSIDARLDHIVREELETQVKKFDAIGGAGMIYDVHTGEILAMVSLPDFDPNAPTADDTANNVNNQARFNRNTLGIYEMGSTFKIFTISMGLTQGLITLDSRFDNHPLKIGKFTIKDFHPIPEPNPTIRDLFIHSSNIGASRVALAVGAEAQHAFFEKMGLLEPVKIELPEIGYPAYPKQTGQIYTATMSYGHGISVSPLHMARAVGAIVNNGHMHQPTLLKVDAQNALEDESTDEPVVSEFTSTQIRELMRLTVLKGTGNKADVDGYNVGGKTGTAEKIGGHGGYAHKSLLSSFVATFPVEDPRYVIIAIIDEPKGTKESYGFATGGWVAAPAVSGIVTRMASVIGIKPNNTFEIDKTKGKKNASY